MLSPFSISLQRCQQQRLKQGSPQLAHVRRRGAAQMRSRSPSTGLCAALLCMLCCVTFTQGVASAGLKVTVFNDTTLASALADSSVSEILLNGTIILHRRQHVWGSPSQYLVRNVTIASVPTGPTATLDFNGTLFAIMVATNVVLVFDGIIIRGIAPHSLGHSYNKSTGKVEFDYYVPRLGTWPSASGQINSTIAIRYSSLYFAPSFANYSSCNSFQESNQATLQKIFPGGRFNTVGSSFVFTQGNATLILPMYKNMVVFNETTAPVGSMTYHTSGSAAICDNSLVSADPPNGQTKVFHWWGGLIIGLGVGGIVVVLMYFLWRRQRRRLRAIVAAGALQSASTGSGSLRDSMQKRVGLGSAPTSGSGNYDVLLTDHHMRLLRMRTTSSLEGIELGPELGRGSFGKVYKGRWQGALVAIKIVESAVSNLEQGEENARESLVAASVSHPNVVACYKICNVRISSSSSSTSGGGTRESDGPEALLHNQHIEEISSSSIQLEPHEQETSTIETWLLLEYADRGALDKAIKQGRFLTKGDSSLDMGAVLRSLLDVATGMTYLHKMGIVHGDLKSANVLLKSTATDMRGFICKLTDFGLSRVLELDATHVSTQHFGTVPYMPPELLSQGRMTKAVDVYSFAVLMWELFTGTSPYSGMTFSQVIYSVVHQGMRPELPAGCPPQYRALMERCWQTDVALRPPFQEVTDSLAAMVKDNVAVVAVAANAAKTAKAAFPAFLPQLRRSSPAKAPLVALSARSFSFLRPFGGPREKHAVQKGTQSMTHRRSHSASFERPSLQQLSDAALAASYSLAPVPSGDLPPQLELINGLGDEHTHEVVLDIEESPEEAPRSRQGNEELPGLALGMPHDKGLGF